MQECRHGLRSTCTPGIKNYNATFREKDTFKSCWIVFAVVHAFHMALGGLPIHQNHFGFNKMKVEIEIRLILSLLAKIAESTNIGSSRETYLIH